MIWPWLAACVLIDESERDIRTPHWVDVSVGNAATCAVRDDGSLRCWGDDALYDWNSGPAVVGDYVSVSVGYRHACALEADGTTVCFGNPIVFDGAESEVGANPMPLTWVQAGVDHSCGGDDSGAFECWGYGTNWFNDAPAGPVDALAVFSDACALVLGEVVCWGSSGRDPDVTGLTVRDLDLGEDTSLCLLEDGGRVWCTDTSTASRPLEELGSGFATIDVVYEGFGCGLDDAGAVACFGMVPDALSELPEGTWAHLSVGSRVACAVSDENQLGCWGNREDPRFVR